MLLPEDDGYITFITTSSLLIMLIQNPLKHSLIQTEHKVQNRKEGTILCYSRIHLTNQIYNQNCRDTPSP
jgi:hypothetical protein